MEKEHLLDEEIAEKSEFEVDANDFYLLTGSIILLLLQSLYLASQYMTGNMESAQKFTNNIFLQAILIGLALMVIRFRLNVYKACSLSRLHKTGMVIVVTTILQGVLNAILQNGIETGSIMTTISKLLNITVSITMIVEAIQILTVPQKSISEKFKYFRFYSFAFLTTIVCSVGGSVSVVLLLNFELDSSYSTLIFGVILVLYSLPDLFLIKAAQPATVSITEQNPEI